MTALHNLPDISHIKRQARAPKKDGGSMTYMQYLDQVARERYRVRHFHEALQRAAGAAPVDGVVVLSLTQHYLQSLQEYYLDF